MAKHKTFRGGDSEFSNLVGMEDFCRKIESERLNTVILEKVWNSQGFYCFILFLLVGFFLCLFTYFLQAVGDNR